MRKVAERHPDSRLHVICPFCGSAVAWINALTWCGNCYVEFYQDKQGRVVFDDERRTARFAFAKAVNKAGGFRLSATRPDASDTDTGD